MRRNFILFAFFIHLTFQIVNFRLSTLQTTRLSVGDSLISTLGLFRATLIQSGCVLSIQKFSNTTFKYQRLGNNFASSNVTSNCNYLNITNGKVMTDNNSTYIYLGQNYSISTTLTIDDNGIIRLIGTNSVPPLYNQQVSTEIAFSQFAYKQNYILPTTNLTVNFMDFSDAITNKRFWNFSISTGQLFISNYNNPNINVSYFYSKFQVLNSQITDFNGQTFPSTIFPNITYNPRCFEPRVYLDFKPPFVFVADTYWPVFTLYDQGRYAILRVSLNDIYKIAAGQNQKRLFINPQQSVCPPYTFEHLGNCVTSCPAPFLHEMRGQYGYCVLTCEQFTPSQTIDNITICSCHSNYQFNAIKAMTSINCPANSIKYPYGCICNNNNQFFDSLLTLTCVTTCPPSTIGISGLCMLCPQNCLTCQKDPIYKAFLQCNTCKTNFTLTNGQCYKKCPNQLGFSIINGVCQQCTDINCVNCTLAVNVCSTCSPLFVSVNGSCLKNCSGSTFIVSDNRFQSYCPNTQLSCVTYIPSAYKGVPFLKCVTCLDPRLYLINDRCDQACPQGYQANSNNYCYCSGNGTITVNEQCINSTICPLHTGWDPISSSCISCPFGCLTCYNSGCTSCDQGFYLYIVPQAVRCRRKSPLYSCSQQNSWNNQACTVTTFSDPALGLTRCLISINNCKICYPQRQDMCSLCHNGFYNVNNTCIGVCPAGSIPYFQTCIKMQIENCSTPYLGIKSKQFLIDYDRIIRSAPYNFYTFLGKQPANDPVGFIPYYQNLIFIQPYSYVGTSQFFTSSMICLKCNDNFGISANHSACVPCPTSCATCYMASTCIKCVDKYGINLTNSQCVPCFTNCANCSTSQKCTKCADGYGLSADFTSCQRCPSPCVNCYMAQRDSCIAGGGCTQFIDYTSKACRSNCTLAGQAPILIDGFLYCAPNNIQTNGNTVKLALMDSAVYTLPDNSKKVYFVTDQKLGDTKGISIPVTALTPQLMLQATGSQILVKNSQSYPIDPSGYLTFKDNQPQNNIYILNTSTYLKTMATSGGVIFSNSAYGTSNNNHPEFVKTWLAYIGYIMSLIILIMHAVYIGNDLMYKVDNTIILVQTVYLFSFAKSLIGKLLAQFYYGWSYSHFAFFPNFFANTVPNNYFQQSAPISYKLVSLDSNVIRNGGWAISLLFTFVIVYFLAVLVCFILKYFFHKKQVWYPRLARNSLLAIIQFLSMSLVFWSISTINYRAGADKISQSFYNTSQSAAWIILSVILIYTIVRFLFNRMGGIYMFKRIIISGVLAATYQKPIMVLPLLILELFFMVMRWVIQSPQKTSQTLYIVGQWVLHSLLYILMFFVDNAGVNTIIISTVIFVIIVVLAHDLTDVYLQSQNEWQYDEQEEQQFQEAQMMKATRLRQSQLYKMTENYSNYQEWSQKQLNQRIMALYDQIQHVTIQNLEVAQKNSELQVQIRTIDQIIASHQPKQSQKTLSTYKSQQSLQTKYGSLLDQHKRLENRVMQIEQFIFSKPSKHSTVQQNLQSSKAPSIQDLMKNSRRKTAAKVPINLLPLKQGMLSNTPKKDSTLRKTKQY